MHRLTLSVNSPTQDAPDFREAAAGFLDELKGIDGLDVVILEKPAPGTRGVIQILSDIVVTGIHIGAFSAIYIAAKDFYDRYAAASVDLKFSDGSTLHLKGLSNSEAERRIKQHIEQSAPPSRR